jgi:hypothetical protein
MAIFPPQKMVAATQTQITARPITGFDHPNWVQQTGMAFTI